MTNSRETINANGTPVSAFYDDKTKKDYLSLTDIAKYKNPEAPNDIIKNWLRTKNTIEYLGLWEQMYNPNFNNEGYNDLLIQAGSNTFVISPKKWQEITNSIGIKSKSGRYGGTYALVDIAFDFASWISPEFRLYLVKDYRQLKQNESSHLNLDWNVNRALSKVNYRIHTDAIKKSLIPLNLNKQQEGYHYASEADMLNVVLFGKTAKQWKDENPTVKGNMRDVATLNQLLVLANLESYNAVLINQGKSQKERMELLRKLAVQQLQTLETVSLNNFVELADNTQKK